MMNSVIIVGILITFVSGVISLALIAHRVKKQNNSILRSLLFVMVTLNLIWVLGLISEFSKSKYFFIDGTVVVFVAEIIFSTCLFISRFLFLIAFFILFENILNLTILNQFKSALKKSALIIMAAWILGFVEIPLNGSSVIVNNLMIYSDILIFGAVIILSVYLFSKSKLIIEKKSKKAIRSLCVIFILAFILACFKWVMGGSVAIIDKSWERILLHSFMFSVNLLIILWTLIFASDLLKRIGFTTQKVKTDLIEIASKYEISKREMDIVFLICEGKTNKEIADKLFISIETVKDHNHNIFQKTGVKNRTQLANLFNLY